jgi:hypothetical protein
MYIFFPAIYLLKELIQTTKKYLQGFCNEIQLIFSPLQETYVVMVSSSPN